MKPTAHEADADGTNRQPPRRKPNLPERICAVCGATYSPTSPRSKTCSRECSAELNRINCLDRAREIAFLTPYKIESDANAEGTAGKVERDDLHHAAPPHVNPEPKCDEERAAQIAEVNEIMARPHSLRYPDSARWSRFQRRAAIAVEKGRLSDAAFYSSIGFSSTDQIPAAASADRRPPSSLASREADGESEPGEGL